ncbi:hypothetical protein TW65_08444 [Stemphylium lycopersici]|uniref:DUF1766-domain-containing protein n=1 Tax=Stemphylium lycopersici TaxID=183478 RepID=A0A364MVH5_STELY|nr:hypothetical protein TW65_08444 [Stemphylium lycopersici]RAR04765.1 DUF1766-domain-containing protein [Stemphylium lycopersici]
MAFSISHTISEMFPHADRPKANTIRSRDGSAFAYQFGQGQGPTKANSVGSKRSLHSQHTPKAGKYPSVEQWTFFSSSIGLVNTGPGLTSLLHSPNIAWLTPPTTTSLSSTSGSVTDNRNEPKTPCRSSNPTLSKNVFTSFTPPTPRSVSLGTETAAKVAVLKTSGTPTSSDCLPSDENETRLDDEEFRPRKIFRNLTQELEAISNANTATAQIKLCLKPSLSFSFEESKPISSRTRSKVGGVCPRQVTKDNAQECPVSNGPWKTKPSYNKLEKLLELILPFSIQGRLRMNPYRCVATIGGDPSKRCASQSKGRGNPSRRKFERLVACKEEGSYDTMIQRIERLVQRTMCGSHQNVALKQPQAGARIDQLWKLLVDVAGALSDDFPEIDQWIDTICNNEASIEHVEPLFVSPTPSGRINVKVNAAPRPSTKPNKTLQKIQASYSLKFMPFLEDRTRDLTVAEALVKEIQKPLNKSDHRNGFIYIFWDKENFGRLKIGFTKDLSTPEGVPRTKAM